MNILRLLFVMLIASFSFAACGNKEEVPPAVVIAQQRTHDAQQRLQDAQQAASAALAKQAAAENQRDVWKTGFFLAVVVIFLVAFVGIAMGSSARKQVERSRRNE